MVLRFTVYALYHHRRSSSATRSFEEESDTVGLQRCWGFTTFFGVSTEGHVQLCRLAELRNDRVSHYPSGWNMLTAAGACQFLHLH